MGWIAGKKQKIKRGGDYIWVDPGDPIPEAEHWPNRSMWLRQGVIRWVKEPGEQAKSVMVETRKTNAFTKPKGPSVAKVKAKREAKPKVKEESEATVETASENTSEPLSGPGQCPDCGKDFLRLGKHKCSKKASE